MAEANEKLDQKLSAARTRLIMERPFLGALTLRLPLVEGASSWCKTTATDAKKIYFNAQYVEGLNLKQLQFMLAHNALHCALSHFYRKHNRDQHRWDVACDFAVNAMLIDDGLVAPQDALYFDGYRGMTAEEIYPLIDENTNKEPLDQHVYDQADSDHSPEQDTGQGTSPNKKPRHDAASSGTQANQHKLEENGGGSKQMQTPPPLHHSEKEDLALKWQQSLAGAAQQAMQAGKLSGSMLKMVDFLLQPNVPWRSVLAHFMTRYAKDDYNFMRPSRRSTGLVGEAIYPSLHSAQIQVVIVIDSSGSIGEKEAKEFVNEVSALKSQVNAQVTLIVCDEAIVDTPQTYAPWETMDDFSHFVKAGRGTNFSPPFSWLEEQGIQPDVLVYFTDAKGQFPAQAEFPVLWLVKGKASVPWGQRIQLN